MNRCMICGYKTKDGIFCNKHKEIISKYYNPSQHLLIQHIILNEIKKQLIDIYYIKKDNLLTPIDYKELNGREKFLEYSKKETEKKLYNGIHDKLENIFSGSVDIKSNNIYITKNNGKFDYDDFNKLNDDGFIFQHISYNTKLFSRNVKCVISVIFDPEIPKGLEIKWVRISQKTMINANMLKSHFCRIYTRRKWLAAAEFV